MLKKIKTKKTHLLSKGEQSKLLGGDDCPIPCGCGINCGDNLAHRQSKNNSCLPK